MLEGVNLSGPGLQIADRNIAKGFPTREELFGLR